jgi:catechol 2,3-dioxygenase-like lactoylglutathione lyase family enzyme
MTTRISRIILFVRDVAQVAAFYEKHFGLQRIESNEDGWLELSAGAAISRFIGQPRPRASAVARPRRLSLP